MKDSTRQSLREYYNAQIYQEGMPAFEELSEKQLFDLAKQYSFGLHNLYASVDAFNKAVSDAVRAFFNFNKALSKAIEK